MFEERDSIEGEDYKEKRKRTGMFRTKSKLELLILLIKVIIIIVIIIINKNVFISLTNLCMVGVASAFRSRHLGELFEHSRDSCSLKGLYCVLNFINWTFRNLGKHQYNRNT